MSLHIPMPYSRGTGTSAQPWNPTHAAATNAQRVQVREHFRPAIPASTEYQTDYQDSYPGNYQDSYQSNYQDSYQDKAEPQLPPVDSHTVLAAQIGNPQASTHILRCYHDCVYRFLWQMTHQELGDQITEDLCQETFARFFLALRSEANPLTRPLKSWLLDIARMVGQRHLRQRQQELQAPAASTPMGLAPAQNANTWVAFADAMQELSPAHREILYLRQEQGLSYVEIARALGVCVGTVKSRLSRSRKALERAMQKQMHRSSYT